MKLHVITYATDLSKTSQFIRSCKENGIEPYFLRVTDPNFTFRIRLISTIEYLNKILNDRDNHDDLVLFCDSYDLLVLSNSETIINNFLSFGKKIVISVEFNPWPDPNIAKYFAEVNSPLRFPNSGCYIGYPLYLKNFLEKALSINESTVFSFDKNFKANMYYYNDDQYLLSLAYLDDHQDIELDYYCKIFINLVVISHDDIILNNKKKYIKYRKFQNIPCIVHFNGPVKFEIYDLCFNYLFNRTAEDREYSINEIKYK